MTKPFGAWEMPYYVTEKGDSWTGNMARDLEEAMERHAKTPGAGKHWIIIRAMNEVLPVNRVRNPEIDLLSKSDRQFVESRRYVNAVSSRQGYEPEWLEIIDQLAPKPQPKTNEELVEIVQSHERGSVAAHNALIELLDRANKKKTIVFVENNE